ncbi:MAG: DNA polymerase III subunit beta [Candidatus Berkelbacteria bacterium]|nr:DNA polymerase III subunit beta [Candidatus Berkelbacteria bacterium]
MKISCTQEKLNRGLSTVSRIVGNRTTLPVLSNIYLETGDGCLKLSATDLEIGIVTTIAAKVDEAGATTVPARLMSEFVANNSDPNILLETKDNTTHLKSERFDANIKGIDPAEFPVLPEVSKEAEISISAEVFSRAVSEVIIACANDETRPVLSGIYFRFEAGVLYLVATDSYRLSEKKIKLTTPVPNDKEFIVPARTMQEILRISSSLVSGEKIILSASENQVAFVLGETKIISRLIEGAFPNYKQIIPTAFRSTAKVELKDFAAAVKMAALFARQGAGNIKVKLANDQIILTSIADQVGDNISNLPAEISGDEVEITFNAKFILDLLTVVTEKKILIEVNDKTSPGIIKPEKESDFAYIIMPLRVEE